MWKRVPRLSAGVYHRSSFHGIKGKSGFDWDNLRFTHGTVNDLRQLLDGYKSTFEAAVAIARISEACGTAANSEYYTKCIQAVIVDLEDLAKNINRKPLLVTSNGALHVATCLDFQIRHEAMSIRYCIGYCWCLLDPLECGGIGLIQPSSSSKKVSKPTNIEEPNTIINSSNNDAVQFFISASGEPVHGINGEGGDGSVDNNCR